MANNKLKLIKWTLVELVFFFVLIFLNDSFGGNGNSLLIITILFLATGVVLKILTYKAKIKETLKRYLLFSSYSAIGFGLSLGYGIYGIWGFYEINDFIYIPLVIVTWLGFVVGIIGSFTQMRRV